MIARQQPRDDTVSPREQLRRQPSRLNVKKLTLSATRRYAWCIPRSIEVNRAEIQHIFAKVDHDGSGSITIAEMRELLQETYASNAAAAQQTENYIQRLDVDKDGSISYEEFEKFLVEMVEARNLCYREAIFLTLEDPGVSVSARWISLFIMLLIVVSSTAFVMESMPEFNEPTDDPDEPPIPLKIFITIEYVCIAFFTLEYVLRAICVHGVRRSALASGDIDVFGQDTIQDIDQEEDTGFQRTYKWALQPMNIIDFIAIFPFYLELAFDSGSGLAVFRIIRLARVFRIFKLGKYNEGMKMFGRTIAHALPALYLLFFFFLLAMVLFGAMVFFAEQGTYYSASSLCPDQPGNPAANVTCAEAYGRGIYLRTALDGESYEISPFISIPASFWWVVTTSTTVGYGDMYPTSAAGKLIGTCCMLAGLLVLALPITVIGSNFAGEYEKERMREKQEQLRRREEKEAKKLMAAAEKRKKKKAEAAAKRGEPAPAEGTVGTDALGFGQMESALESIETNGGGKRRMSRSLSTRIHREQLQENMRKKVLEKAASELLERSQHLDRAIGTCDVSADPAVVAGVTLIRGQQVNLMSQVPIDSRRGEDFQEMCDTFCVTSYSVVKAIAAEQRRQAHEEDELSVSKADLLELRIILGGFTESLYKCVPKPQEKKALSSGPAGVEGS